MNPPAPERPLPKPNRPKLSILLPALVLLALVSPRPAPAQDCSCLPVGTVVMWAGKISAIPQGWRLCDGQGGTPNLVDRFVLGAGPKGVGVHNTGGSVVHDHGGSTEPHRLTEDEIPRHEHQLGKGSAKYVEPKERGDDSALAFFGWGSRSSMTIQKTNKDGGRDQGHSHRISRTRHIPPYYALAFIMKVR